MKLKKVLAGFTAAALAVGSVSLVSWAADESKIKEETVATFAFADGQSPVLGNWGSVWCMANDVDVAESEYDSHFIKVTLSDIGDYTNDDGSKTDFDTIVEWGFLKQSWFSFINLYYGPEGNQTTYKGTPEEGCSSEQAIVYFEFDGTTGFNLQAGHVPFTVASVELIKRVEESEANTSEPDDTSEPEEDETTDVEFPEGYEQNGETISGEHTFAAPSWNPSSEDADGSFEYLNASLFTSEDDLIIVSVSSDAGAYPANWQVALGADYDNQAKWNDYSDDNAENKLFIQAKVGDVMAAADDGIDSLDKLNGVYVKLWHAEIGHKIKYSIILAKKTNGVTEPEDPENPGEEKVIKQGEHTFVKSEWGDYTESTIATIEASKLSSVDDYIVVEVTPKQAENSSSWKIGFIPQPVSGEQWNLNYCEEDPALKIRAKVADILAVLDLTSIADINNIVVQVWGTSVGDVIDYTISIESAGGNNNNPTVTEPEETDPPLIIYPPATTEPSATAPAETEPGATVPDVTEPDVSIPDNTDQGGSEPDNTTADEPDVVPGTSIEDSGNSNVGGEGDGTDKPVATGFAIAFVPAAAAAAMAVISKKRK